MVGAVRDHQGLADRRVTGLAVVAGDVGQQGAVLTGVGIEHEGQVGGDRAGLVDGDQVGGPHLRQQLTDPGRRAGRSAGDVHGASSPT